MLNITVMLSSCLLSQFTYFACIILGGKRTTYTTQPTPCSKAESSKLQRWYTPQTVISTSPVGRTTTATSGKSFMNT